MVVQVLEYLPPTLGNLTWVPASGFILAQPWLLGVNQQVGIQDTCLSFSEKKRWSGVEVGYRLLSSLGYITYT